MMLDLYGQILKQHSDKSQYITVDKYIKAFCDFAGLW